MMKGIEQLHKEIQILKNDIDTDELVRIADAIEREVKEGYVELPKDANGEHIHIGDKLVGKYLEGNPVVECTRLTLTNDWMVGHGRAEGTYNLYAHYHEPTVEDVLEELCLEYVRSWNGEATAKERKEVVAKYTNRLQLRKEEDE